MDVFEILWDSRWCFSFALCTEISVFTGIGAIVMGQHAVLLSPQKGC